MAKLPITKIKVCGCGSVLLSESEATSVGKTPGKFPQVMAAPESLTKIHAIVQAAGSTHRVEAAASCCDADDGGGSCQTART